MTADTKRDERLRRDRLGKLQREMKKHDISAMVL